MQTIFLSLGQLNIIIKIIIIIITIIIVYIIKLSKDNPAFNKILFLSGIQSKSVYTPFNYLPTSFQVSTFILLKDKLLSFKLSENPSAELFNSVLLNLNASSTDFKIDIQFFLGK